MKNKSIKLNFIMNALLTMSSMIFPLITFPYISRALQPEGIGKVNFAISIVSYFTMFAQLGIPTYGIRACAQVRDDKDELSKVVQELLLISIVMCTLSYIAFFLSISFIPRLRNDYKLFLIIGSSILLNTIGVEWLYKGLEQYSYITIRSLIFKVIGVVSMICLVHNPSDYNIYGGITVVASYASYILNFLYLRKLVSLKKKSTLNLKRHLKPVFQFFAMACATTIYTNLDTVMLAFMVNDTAVGYYSAAVKIKGVLVGIVTSLGTVLLPRASYYIENNNQEEFMRIAAKALRFVLIVATPLTVYFILYARVGILFISGASFENSIIPMQVIMPTILFIGLSNIMGIQMLIPLGSEKVVLHSEIVGAVVDLVINLILIPFLGATGAAIGTLVAEFFVDIVQYFALKDVVSNTFSKLPYKKVIIGCFVGTLSSMWVKILQLSSFLSLVISGILFFAVYFIILVLMKESLTKQLFNQLLAKVKP